MERRKARGGPCDHARCDGQNCRQWAEEEFTPSPADLELGKKLVEEGWICVSVKQRIIVKWKTPPPDFVHLINPELRGTYWGRLARAILSRNLGSRMEYELQHEYHRMHRPVNSGMVEVQKLSLKQIMAFKKLRKQMTEKRDKDFFEEFYDSFKAKPLS